MKSTWLVEEKTMTYLAVPRDDATWYENVKSSWHVSTEVKVSQGTRGVDGHREGGTASSHHEARGIVFATSGHDAFYVSLAFWTSQKISRIYDDFYGNAPCPTSATSAIQPCPTAKNRYLSCAERSVACFGQIHFGRARRASSKCGALQTL